MSDGDKGLEKKLSFSRDLDLLLQRTKGDEIPISLILKDLNYRSHALVILLLSLPFVTPIPLIGLSTVFGVVIMGSAFSIITGLEPWMPKRWRDKAVRRKTLESLLEKSTWLASRLERFVRPRFLVFSKSMVWVRVHGLMIFILAAILALPAPPGGNALPGVAILTLALGLAEEDGLVIAIGYLLTFINIVLLTLILVYGFDWIMSLFS